jgi:hypothetical protein
MHDQSYVIKDVNATLVAPTKPDELDAWLSMEPTLAGLDRNAHSDSIILYLSAGHMYVVTSLVPKSAVSLPDWDDLLRWNVDPWSSWSIWASTDETGISPPLANSGSKSIDEGEPLVFLRSFEGVPERSAYVEILQKFVHVMGLHHMPDRHAWCRLDGHGDIEDVIRVVELPDGATRRGGRMVLCDRAVLAKYATLTDATLVRMFDLTYTQSGFAGWRQRVEDVRAFGNSVRYRYMRSAGPACYARGVEILPLAMLRQKIVDETWGRTGTAEYASFIAHDWKNNRIAEISCSPDAIANYFTESPKPFEVTPAFFRPEVLLKYKADREKYTLEHRSISCRGTWHLQTFDINEEGQVHTYLVYLRSLPYEEQLHWKQYNEEPKGPISKRAFKTDIEGNWADDYDPLLDLKRKLRDLASSEVTWWKLRDRATMDKVNYPVTTSADEWADELLYLDQLVVEGFDEKVLRSRCAEADLRIKSLGLLERCLIQYGFDDLRAREIIKPFRDIHELRSKVKGHANGSDAKALRQGAVNEHGSLREHFRILTQQCDEALETITTALSL